MSIENKLMDFSAFDCLPSNLINWYLPQLITEMIEKGSQGLCCKSKRVSAIITTQKCVEFEEKIYTHVIAVNEPPTGFVCKNNEACRKICNQVCVHAEENVIIKTFQRGWYLKDSICLHLKIKDGQAISSGLPSCIYCSRKLLQSGVKYMYLFHEDGWKRYTTEEFHKETLKTLGFEE